MNSSITKKEIERLIIEEDLVITDVIDVVIELNGIIGVGLITLGDQLKKYLYNKIDKRQTEES